jgi:hypothetical protein
MPPPMTASETPMAIQSPQSNQRVKNLATPPSARLGHAGRSSVTVITLSMSAHPPDQIRQLDGLLRF